MYPLRFIKLIHLHLFMMRWSWGFMLHNHLAGDFRTHFSVFIFYHVLYYNRLILHLFDLLKYFIIHLPFCLALLELVGFLPLDLPWALIFLLLARLGPVLLLSCPLLLAVDADAQGDHPKYE